MREILFYSFVFNFTVERFITQLTFIANEGDGAFLKVNSQGGDVDSGWGMVAAWRAFQGVKKILVHGAAHSMMAVILLFTEDTTAIEQSKFVLHRSSNFFERENETARRLVDETNRDIRKAFEDRLDISEFERIGKDQNGESFTIDRFFDSSLPAVDVVLNSLQAKTIRLIKNVVSLNAKEADDINRNLIAASSGTGVLMLQSETIENENNKSMDLKELKEKHPDLYAELIKSTQEKAQVAFDKQAKKALKKPEELTEIEAAAATAVTAERDRVAAWNAWSKVDADKVKAGIESGMAITNGQSQEFMFKASTNKDLLDQESSSQGSIDTPDASDTNGKPEQTAELAAFEKGVYAELGLKLPSDN